MKAILCIIGALLFIKFLPGLIMVGIIYFLVYSFFRAIFFTDGDGEHRGSGSSSDDAGSDWSGTGNPHV